jgi:hypothetical protein
VRPQSDEGVELNAEFAVEAEDPYLSLVLESAGGRGRDGGPARNHEYVDALRLLLSRLRDRRAVLVNAVLASQRVADLPEDDRMLVREPVQMVDVVNIEDLRFKITTPQGHIGIAEGAKEGNNRKRIRLRLTVPGYNTHDPARLAEDLATGAIALWTDARGLLESLRNTEIRTFTGKPNVVLGLDGDYVHVITERSPDSQPVPVSEVQNGLDLLLRDRSVPINTDVLRYRSAFVGAVLATLQGAAFAEDPTRVTLDPPTRTDIAADKHFGTLDSKAQVKVRREQTYLRKLLADNRSSAPCALCGHVYPIEFLVAAHIKKRALCTEDERRDLRNIAMLACAFGCDRLYESGWITVDDTGQVITTGRQIDPGLLADRLGELQTRRCTAHTPASEPYFSWHRAAIFATG